MTDLEKDLATQLDAQRQADARTELESRAAKVRHTPANGLAIPGDVGTVALARTMDEQLRKTRAGISSVQSEIDADTHLMNEIWARIQRNCDTLADLRRSESMISAAIKEGSRPAFQRT